MMSLISVEVHAYLLGVVCKIRKVVSTIGNRTAEALQRNWLLEIPAFHFASSFK